VLALLLIARAAPARAQCVIDSVTGTAFGTYDTFSASPLDTAGAVIYRCLVALTITIDLSTGSSAAYAARTMTRIGGGGTLTYNLFLDAARLTVWGNGASGTVHYGPILGLLSGVTVPIYGRVPARQDVATGDYSDTVVVTLNY
jgi:spore coat protein U-like protein